MAEDRRKEAVVQADLIRGWRPKTQKQGGYRPQAQSQGNAGSGKPKPPAGGSGVSPASQGNGSK